MSHLKSTESSEFRTPLPPPSALSSASLIKSIRASNFSPSPAPSPLTSNGSKPPVRKSKFSDQPPASVPPPGVIATKAPKVDAVAAAAAAAARINANLRAKGKLSDQTLLKPIVNSSTGTVLSLIKVSETKKVFNSYVAKIDINDLPLSLRTHFTQVSLQDSINKETGVAISTKGQYLMLDEKKHLEGIDKQLHLYIQSPSQEKTDLAVAKIKEMMSKQKLPGVANNATSTNNPLNLPAPKPIPPGQPALPTGNSVQEKVFVGMDYCVSEFDLKTKLIGVNYANFNFVANATGAKVILRGKGSGFIEPTSGREAFESMYVFISHPNQAGVDAAKKLVYNLISTVHTEYNNFRTKKSTSQTTNFPTPPIKTFSQYPPTLPLNINPYGNVNMPAANAYGSSAYTATAPPIAAAPSPYPSPGTATAFYPTVPPVANPYTAATSPASYNLPVPKPSDQPVPSYIMSSDLPNKDVIEAKAKKRRFQEEQPDDSNLLGYKQLSAHIEEEENKKSRKNNMPNEVVANYYEEDRTTNMPFWMSHN